MDSEKYFALYFPDNLKKDKDKAYYALQDINSNYSKLIQALLPSLTEVCIEIKAAGLLHKDFNWSITVERKTNGKVGSGSNTKKTDKDKEAD